MEYPACDGVLSTGSNGEVICSGSWVAGNQTVTLTELPASEIALLISAALVTCILAYTFKTIRKQMGF